MYKLNNIDFRIAASDSISKFKQLEATTFIQLARPELNFSVSVREIVLLEFDFLSNWLFDIETMLKFSDTAVMSEDNVKSAYTLFGEKITKIEEELLRHEKIFDTKIVDFIKTVHNYCFSADRKVSQEEASTLIKIYAEKSTASGFDFAVETVSDYLQHLLIACHEYNSNIISNIYPPFVSIDGYSPQAKVLSSYTGMLERAKFFRDHGCGNTFIMKSYMKDLEYNRQLSEAQILATPLDISLLANGN